MNWGLFIDIRGAPRQWQNEVLSSELRAKSSDENRYEKFAIMLARIGDFS